MTDTNQVTHFCARIRGMKSRLLSRGTLDEMLDQNSEPFIVERLLQSPYQRELSESLAHFSGAEAVEDAVSRHFVKAVRFLLQMAEGEFRDRVEIVFHKWDILGVKSLIRSQHEGLDREEARASLFPGPTLTVAVLEDLARRETMESLVGGLAAWHDDLCGALLEALPVYREEQNPAVLEEVLDRAYFVDNIRRLDRERHLDDRLLCDLLRMEIDRINLRVVLPRLGDRTAGWLPGGFLPERVLRRMSESESVDRAMEILGNTRYSELVEGLYPLLQTGRYAPLERMFERILLLWMRRQARQYVVSIAVVMEYIWLLYNEVINLRLISRGTARHLPHGRVREELVYA